MLPGDFSLSLSLSPAALNPYCVVLLHRGTKPGPTETACPRSRLELAGKNLKLRDSRFDPRGHLGLVAVSPLQRLKEFALCGHRSSCSFVCPLGAEFLGNYFTAYGSVDTFLQVQSPEVHLKGCILHEKGAFNAK